MKSDLMFSQRRAINGRKTAKTQESTLNYSQRIENHKAKEDNQNFLVYYCNYLRVQLQNIARRSIIIFFFHVSGFDEENLFTNFFFALAKSLFGTEIFIFFN